MNILNVNQNHWIRGGSDTYYFALTALLEAEGHKVFPFASSQMRNFPSTFSSFFPASVDFSNPGFVDLLRFAYSRSAASAIQKYLDHVNFDIAHLHIYYGQLTSSILQPLRRRRIPVVQTLHEYRLGCPTSNLYSRGHICEACKGTDFWQATLKRCNRGSLSRSALSTVETYTSHFLGAIKKVDHFLAVSDFLRDKVISFGVPASKVTTIHNYVDSTKYVAASELGAYMVYFGRLERMKGIFTLLNSMVELRDIDLLVIGDGNDKQEVSRFVEEKGLANVHIMGFKRGKELHDLVRGSICTITPSESYETFGLTLIESFALGRPVICSKIGGMPEVVEEGIDGLLFPAGDVSYLTEQIRWMFDNRERAFEMGVRGRRKVERVFSSDEHYRKVMSIYNSVCGRV